MLSIWAVMISLIILINSQQFQQPQIMLLIAQNIILHFWTKQTMDTNMLIETESSCYRMEGEVIGQGSFGYVRRARDLVTSEMVAVKVVSSQFLEMAANQIDILKRLNESAHERGQQNQKLQSWPVLKFLGSHRSYNQFFIVTDLYGVSLQEFLKRKAPIDELTALNIFYCVLKAVKPLRMCNILHRDLKPANILIIQKSQQKGFASKICDFGLSIYEQIGKTSIFETDRVGTLIYEAPEVLKFKEYSEQSQIWSLGIIFYELIFKKLPIEFNTCKNVNEIYQKLITEPIKFLGAPSEIVKIGERCLSVSTNKRIKFVDLINEVEKTIKKLSQTELTLQKNTIIEKKIVQVFSNFKQSTLDNLKLENSIELNSSVSDFSTVQFSVDEYRNNRKISEEIFGSVQQQTNQKLIANLSKTYAQLKIRLESLKKPKQNSAALFKVCQKFVLSQNSKQDIDYFSPEVINILLNSILKMQMILEYAQGEKQITFNLKQFMYVDTLMKLYEIAVIKNNNNFSALDFSKNCTDILQQHLAYQGQAKSMQYYKKLRNLALSIS